MDTPYGSDVEDPVIDMSRIDHSYKVDILPAFRETVTLFYQYGNFYRFSSTMRNGETLDFYNSPWHSSVTKYSYASNYNNLATDMGVCIRALEKRTTWQMFTYNEPGHEGAAVVVLYITVTDED